MQCLWKGNDGSIITPSILGMRSSGSSVSSRVIFRCVWNWCVSREKSVTVDFGTEKKRVFHHVDAYFSQVTVDHGLQLWDINEFIVGPEAQTVMLLT